MGKQLVPSTRVTCRRGCNPRLIRSQWLAVRHSTQPRWVVASASLRCSTTSASIRPLVHNVIQCLSVSHAKGTTVERGRPRQGLEDSLCNYIYMFNDLVSSTGSFKLCHFVITVSSRISIFEAEGGFCMAMAFAITVRTFHSPNAVFVPSSPLHYHQLLAAHP